MCKLRMSMFYIYILSFNILICSFLICCFFVDTHVQDIQEVVSSNTYGSPNGTRYWVPDVVTQNKPVIGMTFVKLDDVVSMYQSYAEKAGFDIRLSTTKKKNGMITHRYIICSRAGKPICSQNVDSMDPKSKYNLPRSVNFKVTDCKAGIKVKAVNGSTSFELYDFVESHNHPLVAVENLDLTRKRRQLNFSDKDFIHRLSLAKVGPNVAHRMQSVLKGGQHMVRGTKTDFKNFSRDLRVFIGLRDAQMLVNMMEQRSKNLENFTFEYIVRGGELRSLFWADEVAKYNYRVFGDVLAFDATYNTNQ